MLNMDEAYENDPRISEIEQIDANLYKVRLKYGYRLRYDKNGVVFSHSMDFTKEKIKEALSLVEPCFCKDCAKRITSKVLAESFTEPYLMDWVREYEKKGKS